MILRVNSDHFLKQHQSTDFTKVSCVFFEVRTGFLNITYTSFDFKVLMYTWSDYTWIQNRLNLHHLMKYKCTCHAHILK
jgi:hypothetical protein